jgi:hypothetical protein
LRVGGRYSREVAERAGIGEGGRVGLREAGRGGGSRRWFREAGMGGGTQRGVEGDKEGWRDAGKG